MLDTAVTDTSRTILTGQSSMLLQLEAWAGQAATPLTLLLASALLGTIFHWTTRRKSDPIGPLPPSPWPALPVVGHLLALRGGDPRQVFARMRAKYGDIFCFYAGSRLIVVLNGYDVIKEALVKKAALFSHRAETFMSQQIGQGKGIVNTSGSHWKEQRGFALRALRAQGTERSSVMGERIQEEVDALMEVMDKACKDGQPLEPHDLFLASFSNVIINITYGHRFQLDDPTLCKALGALKNCFDNFGNTEPVNFFPLVRHLPGDPFYYWYTIHNMNVLESTLVHPEIAQHERVLESAEDGDVVSAYLREMGRKQANGTSTTMDKKNLVKLAGDLLAGGTEPPSNTTLWILLYMMRFPEVQERCYQEILQYVGKDRTLNLDDRLQMPYLEATILEVQRHADVGPLAMAHGLSDDAQLRGFHIPRDAIVLVNLHSVLHAPGSWGQDPEVFRPERFLGEDGELVRHEQFIPYSMGPRVCPGELMSRMELFLYTASILHRYRLSHDGPTPPPLEGHMALMHVPPKYKLRLERRH